MSVEKFKHVISLDLIKAHVKAHFKRDPKTGKLIFIKDYDDKRHKHLLHTIFKKGDKVKVNKPKSKHHGKEVEVASYNEKYGIATKVPGQKHAGEFHPHHLGHVDSKNKVAAAPKPPVKASQPPVVASTPAITTMAQAKAELGVVGLAYSHKDMLHEINRESKMTAAQLETRVGKIKSAQKLYNAYRVLSVSKKGKAAAEKIKTRLIDMAKAQQAPSKPAPDKKPDPVPAATSDPDKFVKGEKVKINNPRSKFHDKKGTVTNHHDKYGVRVKLDDGSWAEVKPKTLVRLDQNPVDKKLVVKPDKPKEEKKPEIKVKKPKTSLDFPNNYNDAWKHLDNKKSIAVAKTTGMVPLDEDAKQYLQNNLNLITKAPTYSRYGTRRTRTKITSKSGYTIPKWATHYQQSYALASELMTKFISGYNEKGIMNLSKKEWEGAGYDYDGKIKTTIDRLELRKKYKQEVDVLSFEVRAVNEFMSAFRDNMFKSLRYDWSDANKLKKYYEEESLFRHGEMMDHPIHDVLKKFVSKNTKKSDEEFENVLDRMSRLANNPGIDPKEITMRDVYKGLKGYADARKNTSTASGSALRQEADKYEKSLTQSALPSDLHDKFFNTRSGARGVFQKIDYFHDEIADFVNLPSDVVNASSKVRKSNHFSGSFEMMDETGYSANALVSTDVQNLLDENEDIKKVLQANLIAENGQTRMSANYGRDYKFQLFKKGLIDTVDTMEIGVKIARKKGDNLDAITAQLTKTWLKTKKAKGVAKTPKLIGGNTEPPPSDLGCTFRSVDPKTFDFVKKKVDKHWDQNNHGGFYFKIHGIYQIGAMDHYGNAKKFEKKKDNSDFGYHSTSFHYASKIVKSKYRKSSSGMLGPGVYATGTSSKSAQYLLGDCRVTRTPGTRGVFLINKVSKGKVHDYSQGANNNKRHHTPNRSECDTLFVPKNGKIPTYSQPLVNSEYITNSENAVLPMYWVDMELTRGKRYLP